MMVATFSISWEHNNVSYRILFPVSQVQQYLHAMFVDWAPT